MTDIPNEPTVVVAGAGSIGCFIGGLLCAEGRKVHFLAREHMANEMQEHGLTLTDYSNLKKHLEASKISVTTNPEVLASADIVLVTVKSAATSAMAALIAENAKPSAIVVSLQNGVSNSIILKDMLSRFDVRAGMVPFNVVQLGNGSFHRGTSGGILIEGRNGSLSSVLNVPDLPVGETSPFESIQWGKLLINLNNAPNALSGLSLMEQLHSREWRKLMADQMSEAMVVLNAANQAYKTPTPVPAWLIPIILKIPTPLFKLVAKQMLEIDPKARSSMWEDFQKGRKSEIDELQGEIVRLGEKLGIPTPINSNVLYLVKEIDETGAHDIGYTAEQIRP